MSMVPPPVAPVALTRAPSSTSTFLAVATTSPPPPVADDTSSVPPMFTCPAFIPPVRTMLPSLSSTVFASMTPVLLTTLASSAFLAPAVMTTCPPSARIRPLLSATLSRTLLSTCMWTRLLPVKVSVAALPAPSATVPSCALITP